MYMFNDEDEDEEGEDDVDDAGGGGEEVLGSMFILASTFPGIVKI